MTTAAADRDTLIDRARTLRPLLQAHAEETDAGRRLPEAVVTALRKEGMCRLMVPYRFGGHQTSIRTYIETLAELGRGCGSTAWVASLINVCAWLASLFPERAQRDVWGADPDAWIAGSLNPIGATRRVDGGWRVSGRWPWASGSLHAQWAACGIRMTDDAGQIVNVGLSLMPMADLSIEDTWHMAGMRGTGSNTIVADDVFVPEHRFMPYPPAFEGHYLTEHADAETVYRAAFVPVTVLILASSQLGIARAAFDYVREKATARGITHTQFRTQAESAGFQMLLAQAAVKIDTAWLHAMRAADDLDRYAQSGYPDLTARARMRMDTSIAAKECREAVDILISAHGTSSLADGSPMQRLWRDIHLASHHAITEWQVNLEVYGKALLGQQNITHLI